MRIYTHSAIATWAYSRKSRVYPRDSPHSLDSWFPGSTRGVLDLAQKGLANAAAVRRGGRALCDELISIAPIATGEQVPPPSTRRQATMASQ
jgi:hypothetical protein